MSCTRMWRAAFLFVTVLHHGVLTLCAILSASKNFLSSARTTAACAGPAHAAASRRGKTSFDSLPRAISNLTLPTHNDKLHLLEKIYNTLVRILLPEELIDAHEPHQSQGIVNKSLKQPVLELDNGAVCCQCIKIHWPLNFSGVGDAYVSMTLLVQSSFHYLVQGATPLTLSLSLPELPWPLPAANVSSHVIQVQWHWVWHCKPRVDWR